MKVGIGFDIHPFVKNRKLFLGGVEIPFSMGLKGHSDGDALIHAIIDAILGAKAKGDKGKFFPDTDEEFRGISSLKLLEKTMQITKAKIINLDCVVICEKPKIAPFYEKMKKKLAKVLKVSPRTISIKSTRMEGLGIKDKGIACFACCLIK